MGANAQATVTLSLIDRVTGPLKRLSARLANLSRRMGLDRIGTAVGRLGKSITGLGAGLAATTGRLSAFLGLLGAGGAGAIATAYGLAKSAADAGDAIAKTARQLGIGAEALQEYRYAAKMSGVEQASLEKGMMKFGINVSDAAKGNKAMAKEFANLGISIKDSSGKLRSMDEVFTDAVEAISKLPDPMDRSRAAMKLFGKGGVEMTRLFEIGADGLVSLREEARRTGHVISQRAADFSEVFGDNVERLQKRIEGLKLLVGVQLMPVFNDIVVGLTEWYDANRALVTSTLTAWVKRLSGFLKDLVDPASDIRVAFRQIGESMAYALSWVQPLTDRFGALNVIGGVVAAWIAGPMVAAIASLAAAFVNLGIVIMSTPFGWILAGVAGVAASVYVLYQKWDEFLAYWGNLWGRIREGFSQGFVHGVIAILKEFNPVTHIVRGINAVIEYFTGIDLMEHGSRLIQSLTAGISAGAQQLGADITAAIEQGWAAFETWWSGFSGRVRAAGAAIVQALWDGLKAQWADVVAWMKSAVADLVGWLPESIRSKLGLDITADVTGGHTGASVSSVGPDLGTAANGGAGAAANDNAAAAGAAVGRIGGAALYGVPTGARQDVAAGVPANDNAGTVVGGDVENNILTNAGNTITTTTHATVHITAPPGADAAAIGAAVRKELETANRKAAAASQSRLSD